ncbi:MAG: hypothetical protein Hyperionvirus4_126 [Hyperionvirus sp.]|uniref:Uncharacterized protein n=1 Tax=Hyperionvirus sp. TaxID=2487770 RepID=A0A3G5AAB1_9VIRU|nr:MAG: hypothetical protein Hyperionvirus4_126 [Hyperionvirus sp.]
MNLKMNQKMKHRATEGSTPLREGVDAIAAGDLSASRCNA